MQRDAQNRTVTLVNCSMTRLPRRRTATSSTRPGELARCCNEDCGMRKLWTAAFPAVALNYAHTFSRNRSSLLSEDCDIQHAAHGLLHAVAVLQSFGLLARYE